MLLIVRRKTQNVVSLGLKMIVTVLVLVLVVSHLIGMYRGNSIREGWLREDRPSGNSLRVERAVPPAENEESGILDRFVVQLKGFYLRGE